MPDDESPLEPRLSALEARMNEVEAEQAATRMLAAGTDRELSEVQVELRVHRTLIQALQQTQSETLTRVRAVERALDAGFAEMRAGFAEMRAGFDAIADRFAGVDQRLDRLAGES